MMTKAKLKTAMAMMADQDNVAREVAEQLTVSLSTLYTYVDGKGRPKPRALALLALWQSATARTRLAGGLTT